MCRTIHPRKYNKKKYAKEEEEEVLFLLNKLLSKRPTLLDSKHFGYRAKIRLSLYSSK